jgi:hypothetical protein
MKHIVFFVLLGIFFQNIDAQPRNSKAVNINNITYGQDTLYFKSLGYEAGGIHLQKEKNNAYSYNAISAITKNYLQDKYMNDYYHFIYQGDTMSLKLFYLAEYPDYLCRFRRYPNVIPVHSPMVFFDVFLTCAYPKLRL